MLAPAKINLWLNVVGRRADGYHLLNSLVAFTDLADEIEASPSDRLSLTVDGPFAATLGDEADNLVLKAARLLADRAGVAPRVALRLGKHVPVAAGLGGGSADAAAALRALIDLWRVALPVGELFDLAARLGADVPMCLAGRAALVSGIGERLGRHPPCRRARSSWSTPAFRCRPPRSSPSGTVRFLPHGPCSRGRIAASFAATLAERGNDLTDAAVGLRPEITRVLAFLRSSEGVCMPP